MLILPSTKVLLATDGSEDAALAARIAAGLSAGAGAELHIIRVLEPFPCDVSLTVTSDIYSDASAVFPTLAATLAPPPGGCRRLPEGDHGSREAEV